jgi:hypothetical protein
MPIQPLAADLSNKADFINSLFSDSVRDPSQNQLQPQIQAGSLTYAYADPASCGLILNAWLAGWQSVTGGHPDQSALAHCPGQDLALLTFLSGYVNTNDLDLCVPQLTLDGFSKKNLAVYANTGYQRVSFINPGGAWQYGTFDANGALASDPAQSTVARFLQLLFYGAHIVTISSSKDGGDHVADFRDHLTKTLPHRNDLVSSHYGCAAADSGRYYFPQGAPGDGHNDVESMSPTSPPGDEPLLFAFLAGITALTHMNGFCQLEGWPAQLAGGKRHNADYQANSNTLWNFSTYGASAYSEKRSTPVFLAKSNFDLKLHSKTGMPYYWGANSGNVGASWMHPELVEIKSTAPAQ